MTQNLNFGTGADAWPDWPENFFGTEQFFEQIVQISVIFIYNKSISMKIKEWCHMSLTSNISAKTLSNWTCRGCFENVRTSRFQICPWF